MGIFSGTKSRDSSTDRDKTESWIGADVEFEGDVVFQGNLRLSGRVRGNVASATGKKATLYVQESGVVEGDVTVAEVVIEGKIEGEVRATEFAEIRESGYVEGSLRTARIRIELGGGLTGYCEVSPPTEKGKGARPAKASRLFGASAARKDGTIEGVVLRPAEDAAPGGAGAEGASSAAATTSASTTSASTTAAASARACHRRAGKRDNGRTSCPAQPEPGKASQGCASSLEISSRLR